MKKFIKIKFIVLISFIIFIMISTTVFALNATIDENVSKQESTKKEKSSLNELQQEKKEIESNLEQSNMQMELVETELSDLLLKVEEISLEILEKSAEIDKLNAENDKLGLYIKNVETDLKKITENYNKNKETLKQRLIATYKRGKTTYLDVLLNSNGLMDFISNYYLLSKIIDADNALIEEVSTAKKYMENLDVSLKEKKAIIEENKAEIRRNTISLENMQVLKNIEVAELSEKELELHNQIEQYQTEVKNIEKEIRFLSIADVGSEYIGGKMAWPVPGYTRITSQYGMRTHPITGIYKLHTGTDIGAPLGAMFIAANSGVVVKAQYNSAYGNMVIIDHGGGVNTLYAHGSEILVELGQTVEQGTPVLKVGSTGYSTGPHAHFEVRVNGEYRNPLEFITSYNSNENNSQQVIINQ
ncbi:MAG: peptidoglycan DD-metalloendopeptidase family protein [Clostridia bacterium]|nr:peptidoglycan DD-metalloendopeptidase family protein [Clostridia bacterium]